MEKMKLGVIGIGAVGSAISKGFEYLGHDVVGYDNDVTRISQLKLSNDRTNEISNKTYVSIIKIYDFLIVLTPGDLI